MVISFIMILLLQLCFLLQNANANYLNGFYRYPNEESESQENNSDMNYKEFHHHQHHDHHGSSRHHGTHLHHSKKNKNISKLSMTAPQIQLMPMPQIPIPQPQPQQPPHTMNQMAMPQMQMSMSQPQSMSQMQMPMPQMSMPHMSMQQMPMQQMSMQQMPQMQMPQQMPMPSMSMPMMQMPDLRMPMQNMQMPGAYSSSLSDSYQNQNLLYFPFSPQFTNFFKSMMAKPNPLAQSTPQSVVRAATTTTMTTARITTTSTTTPRPAPPVTTTTTEKIKYTFKPNSNVYLKYRSGEGSLLEKVLKNAMGDFANIIVKTPEKTSSGNNRYRLTSLRKTKPTWMPKFGIVPIPDNMAHKLMSEMRDMKDIRRNRSKRLAIFHFKY